AAYELRGGGPLARELRRYDAPRLVQPAQARVEHDVPHFSVEVVARDPAASPQVQHHAGEARDERRVGLIIALQARRRTDGVGDEVPVPTLHLLLPPGPPVVPRRGGAVLTREEVVVSSSRLREALPARGAREQRGRKGERPVTRRASQQIGQERSAAIVALIAHRYAPHVGPPPLRSHWPPRCRSSTRSNASPLQSSTNKRGRRRGSAPPVTGAGTV